MPERTQRGEEDRKREDAVMTGEPVEVTRNQQAATPATTAVTRDKGVEPSEDERREGHGVGK